MSKKRSIKEVQDFRDSVKRVVALLSGKTSLLQNEGTTLMYAITMMESQFS